VPTTWKIAIISPTGIYKKSIVNRMLGITVQSALRQFAVNHFEAIIMQSTVNNITPKALFTKQQCEFMTVESCTTQLLHILEV